MRKKLITISVVTMALFLTGVALPGHAVEAVRYSSSDSLVDSEVRSTEQALLKTGLLDEQNPAQRQRFRTGLRDLLLTVNNVQARVGKINTAMDELRATIPALQDRIVNSGEYATNLSKLSKAIEKYQATPAGSDDEEKYEWEVYDLLPSLLNPDIQGSKTYFSPFKKAAEKLQALLKEELEKDLPYLENLSRDIRDELASTNRLGANDRASLNNFLGSTVDNAWNRRQYPNWNTRNSDYYKQHRDARTRLGNRYRDDSPYWNERTYRDDDYYRKYPERRYDDTARRRYDDTTNRRYYEDDRGQYYLDGNRRKQYVDNSSRTRTRRNSSERSRGNCSLTVEIEVPRGTSVSVNEK